VSWPKVALVRPDVPRATFSQPFSTGSRPIGPTAP
jgi:hypothetical protein